MPASWRGCSSPTSQSGRFNRGPSALGTDVIPDERIGVDAEEFLAVIDAVAIGIRVEGISAVEVGFVTIGDTIAIRVRVGGIRPRPGSSSSGALSAS